MLKRNYHTHTVRCHHASGTEREYIEAAIAGGMKVLGFSDHAPQPYENGFVSGPRMLPEELEGYVETLTALREEYKDRIEILIGLETEYFPDVFERFLKMCGKYEMDYLILAQHFTKNEYDGCGVFGETADKGLLTDYTDQIIAGLKTGKFAYLCHPDCINFVGDEEYYKERMTLVCRTAKELDIPLEINLYGYSDHRHYPSERFFKIAAEVGNTVIYGNDAHTPSMIPNDQAFKECEEIRKKLGLELTDKIKLTLR